MLWVWANAMAIMAALNLYGVDPTTVHDGSVAQLLRNRHQEENTS